jgi:aryl-alcohol dehydrogenase-like predicted oxidoreductase
MKYSQLKDLHLSKIILGTWAIGGAHWGTYDENAALATIETAIDFGITTIDTAPAYNNGHAEELIAKATSGKRDKILIATKCGIDTAKGFELNLRPHFIRKEIENSLRRLNTDYIDIYQCHWPDTSVPISETMEELNKLQTEGKIKHIGICNFRDNELREAIKYSEILTYQPEYSLLKRDIEKDLQKTCIEKHIGIIPYGVLGGGVLTGKYKEPPSLPRDDARSMFYPYYNSRVWPQTKKIVDQLQIEAQEKGYTPGQIAIAWALKQPGVTATIIGARSPQQIKDHIKALELVS